MNVKPARRADTIIKTDSPELQELLEKNRHYIIQLGKVGRLEISPEAQKPQHAASAVVRGAEIYVPLEGLIDLEIEKSRLEKEMERLNEQIDKTARKLSNKDFTDKAPTEIVEREKAKQQEYQEMLDKIVKNLESLVGW
jgi:valyl-tRNA synthetase